MAKRIPKGTNKHIVLTKAGVAELARLIAEKLPNPAASRLNVANISFRRRKVEKKYKDALILDTSALIDARILQVIKTGFLTGIILVIPSVIEELKRLADSANDGKRIRGRRGLDCLNQIKKSKNVKLLVLSTEPKDETVDAKLVTLSKKARGRLITVDFNLNKVAKVKGITVLNVNELANALKTPILPRDELLVQITDRGKVKDQGVGYLTDGTMVVVEGGVRSLGKKISVVVHRVLQTEAGQMVFSRVRHKET